MAIHASSAHARKDVISLSLLEKSGNMKSVGLEPTTYLVLVIQHYPLSYQISKLSITDFSTGNSGAFPYSRDSVAQRVVLNNQQKVGRGFKSHQLHVSLFSREMTSLRA